MEKWKEHGKVFLIGSVGYSVLELLWRGFTHWTMSITGGICFVFLYGINNRKPAGSLLKCCFLGSCIITLMELLVGCVVNLWLKWDVWDYSRFKWNLWGQICAFYSVLWFLLCMPVFFFSHALKKRM